MRFLIRLTFWLSLVIYLLPNETPTPVVNAGADDSLSQAASVLKEMGQFCDRKPETCAIGTQAAAAISHQVQTSAKKLFEVLRAPSGSGVDGGRVVRPDTAGASQDTLTPEDLLPAWRGPEPRRTAKRPA